MGFAGMSLGSGEEKEGVDWERRSDRAKNERTFIIQKVMGNLGKFQ